MNAKQLFSAGLLLLSWSLKAQLITVSGTAPLPIPPGAPAQTVGITQSVAAVSGVGTLGGCVTIENVTIDVAHTWVGDVGILLVGPGGQVLELTTGNGGSGDNFTNTVFSDAAPGFITAGFPPYTGNFRPEGRVNTLPNPYNNTPALGTYTFANTFNGTNADGNWTLYINDFVSLDVGTLFSWSITFNLNGGGTVLGNAGPDVSICEGGSTTLLATGGTGYQWDTGANTASTTVTPMATTTYTVTVTNGGCGSDTDEVTVTVAPKPSVAFSAANTDVCAGACLTLTANFTGVAPFQLQYRVVTVNGNGPIVTQSFSSVTATFSVCAPAGTPAGPFQVEAVQLTDNRCTCN
jgi:subtilisin-like proprotein convertase family protein